MGSLGPPSRAFYEFSQASGGSYPFIHIHLVQIHGFCILKIPHGFLCTTISASIVPKLTTPIT